MSQFSPGEEQLNSHTFAMAQDRRGVQYFATKSGLLHFDGREWILVGGMGAVYAVASDDQGRIFLGGSNGFGEFDSELQRVTLWSDSTVRNVYGCETLSGKVYFLNDEGIFCYSEVGKRLSFASSPEDVTGIYEFYGIPYAGTASGKLLRIEGNALTESGVGPGLQEEIIFASRLGDSYLVGTGDSKVYLVTSDLAFKEIILEDAEYAELARIMNGVWVNEEIAGLGTLRGGVIFFNPRNGKTDQIVNYSTGLPDNEVFSLMSDRNSNIWVAHNYGFTRVAPYIPFRSFNYYNGLKGNVLCAITYRDTIYVGTSQGLFRLGLHDVYQDIVYYVTVIRHKKLSTGEESYSQQIEEKKTRKGLFGFLKGNKDNEERKEQPQNQQSQTSRTISVQEKRTKRVLLSSSYAFEQVKGIDSKVSQLREWGGALIASGLSGVFKVNGVESEPMLEQPVRFLLVSQWNNVGLFATYSDEFGILTKDAQVKFIDPGTREPIHYMFEGGLRKLWMCGLENVYELELKGDSVVRTTRVKVNNPNSDETVGTALNNNVLLVNSSGVYSVDDKLKCSRLDSLPADITSFFATPGNIWFTDRHRWRNLTGVDVAANMQFLALLRNIRYLREDRQASELWIVSGANELYRFEGEKEVPYNTANPVFLKEVDLADARFPDFRRVRIDEEHSKVAFKAVLPDYLNGNLIAYRYKLQGLNDRWSEWSFDNKFEFPFLPSGEYTLMVEARNVFGKISAMTPASFEVLPPYWRRSWFYGMEITVFTLLIILSFRLSSRYRIVSRLLTLLTIILLIEFIQTVLGATFVTNSSPVTDFFIQVVVALMILPVEGYLRKAMLRSLEKKGGFYKLINPDAPQNKEKSA